MALAVRYASMIPKSGNEELAAKHRKTVMIHLMVTAVLDVPSGHCLEYSGKLDKGLVPAKTSATKDGKSSKMVRSSLGHWLMVDRTDAPQLSLASTLWWQVFTDYTFNWYWRFVVILRTKRGE